MDFINQHLFGPIIFLAKTTSMTTTTIKMGFDTIEINLVSPFAGGEYILNISYFLAPLNVGDTFLDLLYSEPGDPPGRC